MNTLNREPGGLPRTEHGLYELTDEQRANLPDDARVALAIVSIQIIQESFEESKQITNAIVEATGLEESRVREMNRELLHHDYLERVNAAQPDKVLQLWLSEKGYEFLDAAVRKVTQ
jgi:hypothetical protein